MTAWMSNGEDTRVHGTQERCVEYAEHCLLSYIGSRGRNNTSTTVYRARSRAPREELLRRANAYLSPQRSEGGGDDGAETQLHGGTVVVVRDTGRSAGDGSNKPAKEKPLARNKVMSLERG